MVNQKQKKGVLRAESISKAYPQNKKKNSDIKDHLLLMLDALIVNRKKDPKKKELFNALSNVNLELNAGESLGIIGLNGSGKSTLLQILAGTLQPTSGVVKKNGRIAALLELGSGFNPEFTGKENVYLNAQILGLTEEETNKKYSDIIRFAEIGDFIDQPVRTYSSGMMLRLAFAVVAHVDPDVLIIDEALAVGDARFQARCFYFLESLLRKKKSIILVSHDMDSVARICTKALLLHQGKVVTKGQTIEVINEYHKVITDQYEENLNENNISRNNQKQSKDISLKLKLENQEKERWTYGGEMGEISKYCLTNKNNEEVSVLVTGEPFNVYFSIKSHQDIISPIYAMKIRNAKGLVIYGTNTSINNVNTKNLKAGDNQEVLFKQNANLCAGDYLISIGFTRYRDGNLEVIHRRHDTIKLKIISNNNSFGITNLFSKIEINNL